MNDTPLSILILDDETPIRESFVDYFQDMGWQPIAATNAESAIDAIKRASPVAAVVDIRLSGMNGDAFIHKAHDIRPDLVFVICTGSPEYRIPRDLAALPQVSKRVFIKPVIDLDALVAEILKTIANNKK